MAVRVTRVGVATNPRNKKKKSSRAGRKPSGARRAKHAKRTKPNPALAHIGYLAANPHQRRKHVAKGKSKKRRGGSHHHKRAAGNPRHGGRRGMVNRGRRRRSMHNPSMTAGGIVNFLKLGLYALVGLVATRQIPQLVLGASNTGIMGYLANAATAFVVGWAAGKFLGRDAGLAAGIGGGVYVVDRVITDNFSSAGQYLSLSGLGDVDALGDIQPGYFPLPVPTDQNGNPIIPAEIRALPPAPAAGPTRVGGGMAGVGAMHSGRFGGRY